MASVMGVARERPVVNDTVAHNKLQFDQKPVGSGAFGAVYKAVHEDWGCVVAYKKLGIQFITEEKNVIALKNEAEIHRQLRHPNIVSMFGVVFEDGHYGLVLEYIVYGSLDAFLDRIKELTDATFRVSSLLKTRMSYEVCCGMSYLHGLRPTPVIHGDLKMPNLLVGEHLNVKISDFGLSKWKDFLRTRTQLGFIQGTPSHIPPEKWMNLKLRETEKFDVYSFGILQWEMYTEEKAFETCQIMIRSLVMTGERPSLDELPSVVPAIKDQISACWHQDPEKRPTFMQLLKELKTLINGDAAETKIKRAVEEVLVVYHKQSQSEHGRKIKRVSQKLCTNIRRIDQILTMLLERRAISRDESESMRHDQPAVLTWAERLIDVLGSKPVNAYECFLDALNSTNQKHLHLLLESEDGDINIGHREILIDNCSFLKTNLNITSTRLLDLLIQYRVLDEQELGEIKTKKTEHERVDQLLHFLMRTSLDQYQLFLKALHISDQIFIAERLGAGVETKLLSPAASTATVAADVSKQADELDEIDSSRYSQQAISKANSSQRISSTLISAAAAAAVVGYRQENDSVSKVADLKPKRKQNVLMEALQEVAVDDKADKTSNGTDHNSTSFLSRTSVVHIIPDGLIAGVAVISNQVFVARNDKSQIDVLDANNFSSSPRLLKISDEKLRFPKLAACLHYNCLYVRHRSSKVDSIIHRVELSDNSATTWTVKGECEGLSVTNNFSLLVTLNCERQIQEYTTHGSWIRTVELNESIDAPWYCIQLSDGNFVVSHGRQGSPLCRVCIVDDKGQVLNKYGGSPGSDNDQLDRPRHLAVDKYNRIFVADYRNNRIQLLSPTLTLLGTVQTPKRLENPFILQFDENNHRLYIGQESHVLVLSSD